MKQSVNRPSEKATGLRMRTAMARAGIMSPANLALISGMNRVTLGAYARGDRRFSYLAARKIARALKCDADWLYWGERREEAPMSVMDLGRETSPKKYTKIVQTLYDVMGNELKSSGYDMSSSDRCDVVLDLAYTAVDELIHRLYRCELAGG